MKLLYPEFLWALSALCIPIIIHLFNFRKFKKIYFSNVELLKDVQLETKSKSQLKHLIVLFIRLIAITLLVFAFAQPYFPVNEETKKTDENSVSIYIDNSYSMDTKGTNGYLLELAKEQAINIAESYSPTSKFHLITNDLEAKHQRSVSRDEFIQMTEEILPSFSSTSLSTIYLRQAEALNDNLGNKSIYWLSDFQKNTFDLEVKQPDTTLPIYLLPFSQESKGNVYIDSVWFESPVRKINGEEILSSTIINNTNTPIEFKLELYINNVLQGFGNYRAEENSTVNCNVPYTIENKGIQHCQLLLTEYPDPDMTFDDDFYLTYNVEGVISIMELTNRANNDSISSISKLFAGDSLYQYKSNNFSNVELSSLSSYDLLFVSNVEDVTSGLGTELINYCNQGGNLVLFPNNTINLESYNNFLRKIAQASIYTIDTSKAKVNHLDLENPLYESIFEKIPENVDLPIATLHYPIEYSIKSNVEYLMTFQNGSAFLSKNKVGKGNFYFSSVPLNPVSSNFEQHALFVATMLRIAEFSQATEKLWNVVGIENTIVLDKITNSAENLIIESMQEEQSFIPEIKRSNNETNLLLYDQIKKAGHYNILQSENPLKGFSFNYNRKESDFSFYNEEELKTTITSSPFGKQITIISGADGSSPVNVLEIIEGKKIWWYCILFVVLLLGLEILILRSDSILKKKTN